MLFAALWLPATTLLIKPGKDGRDRAGHWRLGVPHRKATDATRETAPAAG